MKKLCFGKILVVDDEAIVREVLGDFFSFLDFQSEEAKDGVKGLEAIENSEFCAVFADIRMPGMDGIAFLKQSRRIHPDLPVIIITGHGDEETRMEAIQAGAFAFLPKPFGFQQVKEIMDRIASTP